MSLRSISFLERGAWEEGRGGRSSTAAGVTGSETLGVESSFLALKDEERYTGHDQLFEICGSLSHDCFELFAALSNCYIDKRLLTKGIAFYNLREEEQ